MLSQLQLWLFKAIALFFLVVELANFVINLLHNLHIPMREHAVSFTYILLFIGMYVLLCSIDHKDLRHNASDD